MGRHIPEVCTPKPAYRNAEIRLVPKVKADVSKLPVVKTAPRVFSYLQPFRARWLRSCTKYLPNLESKLLKHNALILKIHNIRKPSFREAFLCTFFF